MPPQICAERPSPLRLLQTLLLSMREQTAAAEVPTSSTFPPTPPKVCPGNFGGGRRGVGLLLREEVPGRKALITSDKKVTQVFLCRKREEEREAKFALPLRTEDRRIV